MFVRGGDTRAGLNGVRRPSSSIRPSSDLLCSGNKGTPHNNGCNLVVHKITLLKNGSPKKTF